MGKVLACAKYYPSLNELSKKISAEHPVEAVQYLRGHRVPEPMFNEYNFGGYLVWSRAPEHKVFIDGRGDVFEEAGVFSDYLRIVELKPDALAILRRYGIRSCLIRKESALATFLAERPDWKRVYADKLSAIFVRQPQSEGELKH